jgi:hypothetical protein
MENNVMFLHSRYIEKHTKHNFKVSQKNSTLEHSEVFDGVFFFERWIVKNQ